MPSCNLLAVKGEILTADEMGSISSYMGSLRYMTKIVPLLIYNIVYHRVDYHERYFIDSTVCGIPYKRFKSKTKDHPLADVFHWCKGVIDAINKKCVKDVYMIFRNIKEDDILENYKFSFTYQDDPKTSTLPQSKDVKLMTRKLFESIESLGKYDKLNDTIGISMEMVFFDGVPMEYDPPNFMQPDTTPRVMRLMEGGGYSTIGYLKTGYHKLKCSVKSPMCELTDTDGDDDIVPAGKGVKRSADEMAVVDIQSEGDQTNGAANIVNISDTSSVSPAKEASALIKFGCACDLHCTLDDVENIKCTVCSMYQHLDCVGFLKREAVPRPYICDLCNIETNEASNKCPRPNSESKKKCGVRLALRYSYKHAELPVDLLLQFPLETKKQILRWIKHRKILKLVNDTPKLDRDNLRTTMAQIFYDFPLLNSMDLE